MGDPASATLMVCGVPIQDTFAEAFDMKATRLILTADDLTWARQSADAMIGFGTSVIACGMEIAIEQELAPDSTPDGRPGFAILAFSVSGTEMEKQIPRRAGQCVLTCPTTALFSGFAAKGQDASQVAYRTAQPGSKRMPLGKNLRYFGDGHQISKLIDGVRYWRIPVMDGEFVCQHDVPRVEGVGGGNFLLLGDSIAAVTLACRAAIAAIGKLPGVTTPFPGGATRSGSKVGSKYKALFASTNEAYCPDLRWRDESLLDSATHFVLEVVIDGMSAEEVSLAMAVGIRSACEAGSTKGLLGVTAGNYGGKLGRHHFHLRDVLSREEVS